MLDVEEFTFRDYVILVLGFMTFSSITAIVTLTGITVGNYINVIAKYIVVASSLGGMVGSSYVAIRVCDYLTEKLITNKETV